MTTLEALASTLTIAELADKSGRSISEIVAFAMPSNGHARDRAASATVDTQTASARDRYDARVLKALQAADGWSRATQIRERVGGSPLQIRTALHRLIERGVISQRGQARATEYWGG